MKVLHTADLHMDRAFEGIPKVPSKIANQFIQANQKVLTRIIDTAIQQAVDLVIFAGDTFHQSRTSIMMQSFLINQLKRLEQAAIPVVITFGNHDYYAKDRYWFDFPSNVFLFEKETVETIHFETSAGETVFISGFSYEHPWIEADKGKEFPEKERTADIHIGIYHGESSRKSSQNYAPFSLTELKGKGYDYWALGHIHQPQVVSASPLIVYAGTPQGHTKKERNLQGVAIATIGNGHSTVHFEPVAAIEWYQQTYQLTQWKSSQEALDYLLTTVITDFSDKKELSLVEVLLTETEGLDETFRLAVETGEFLRYLQEQCALKTDGKLFLFSLKFAKHQQEIKEQVLIPANPELVTQLEKIYLEATIFADTTKEMSQHSGISALLENNQEWRQRCIEAANQLISEDFLIQEEPL